VTPDTYQVARQIDRMEPLLTKEAADKIDLLKAMVQAHINIDALLA
jgi:hypothetical protein